MSVQAAGNGGESTGGVAVAIGLLPPMCKQCLGDRHLACLADGEAHPCGCGCLVSTLRYLHPVCNRKR